MRDLLHARGGPLTRELNRCPGPQGLGQLPERLRPDATTTAVCGYCSTGCGLELHLQRGRAVNVTPARDHPVNRGHACPKGWQALASLDSGSRATTPLLRGPDGVLAPVGWGVALHEFTRRFRSIQSRGGGDATAFLSTGQIASEEMLYLGALARFGLGFSHGDGNTRQCMATAATAYKESFGFDAPPYCYDDLEQSDVIVLVGSNLCIAHPILWQRILRNPHRPVVAVVDPRRSETAEAATHHYAIAPRSDLLFLYAVAHALLEAGAVDRDFIAAHCEGFEGFAAHLIDFAPERVSARVGLPPETIRDLAHRIARGRRVSFWWTMGVNQGFEAVRTAQALINLALMTGNVGRPGTGANSITGQCNAMGSRLFSNTTGLPAGRDFADPAQRDEVARLLGIPVARIPDSAGLAYDGIVDAIDCGRIRGLWIVATNPAHSWIDQNRLQRALRKLEFLVVQDLYADTETAQLADLVLPAAGWGEKEGSFINSERRIGLLKKVRPAPGQALADFHIFRLVAEAWGCAALFERWKAPEDVFASMKDLSRGRPCDISGIEGYAEIDDRGGLQWPFREDTEGTRGGQRLFGDGRFFTPSGRARFVFDAPREAPERPDAAYPFALMTGRGSCSQWHTQTRSGRSPVLRKLHSERTWVQIAAQDAARLGIADGERVRLSSRRGDMNAFAAVGHAVQPWQLFLPMHDAAANRLTFPAFDPHSRQPSYKYCAVAIERWPARNGS